jgi:Mg2+/citrate symporter|tara:strand:- start:146 stop:328 length:183 start_codon:yes stop_codon:yes gene_type:complete
MKKNSKIGIVFILFGLLVLLYKQEGFYGFGGYVDNSWENIIISSILIIFGVLFFKRKQKI